MQLSNVCCALLAASLAASAGAQSAYPDRPIRVIVPVPAGGTPDVVARMVQPGLATALGQQLVVDNRGGAGGIIGVELAARANPDGYTLLFSSPGPLTIAPHMQKQMPYDTQRDFTPISLVSIGPFLLITHPSVPVRSVKELIAAARSEPGKLNYASAGNGAANHLAMELFKNAAGINLTHVPYKGAPQAVTDVLSGQVNLMFNSIPPVIQHIRANRIRLLGIASGKRSPQLPDAPTLSEAGVPGFEAVNWFGLLAPAKTPQPVIARLHEALVKVVRSPELRAQFELHGYDPLGNSPDEFARFIRAESEKYAKAVKISGAKVD